MNNIIDSLDEAFEVVKEYHDADAVHVSKQWSLKEQDCLDILKHATGELFELSTADASVASSNDCLEELADTLSCLFHYAIVSGFSVENIAEKLKYKLELRFTKD